MLDFQTIIVEVIKNRTSLQDIVLMTPPKPELGDIALPCFSFAKEFRKSPADIAKEIEEKLKDIDFIDRMVVSGGYLNFFINKQTVAKSVIQEIRIKKESYGSSQSGRGKKALIEHTSINPNASPHVGRARNAMIGDVIVRLFKFEGYDVDTHYFVNDVGKQIAMLVLGAKDKADISFKDLLDIYVDINNRIERNPELEKEVFTLLNRLESGNEEVKEMFKNIVGICIKGQTDILAELNIKYDTFRYESDYIWSKRTDFILNKLKMTGKLEEDSEGRYVLNLSEFNLPMIAPYFVLTRGDKTSLYPLRDISYSIDKASANADMNVIVLGEDQKLYFQQIKAALTLMGYTAPVPVHYSFVLLSEGKMATRKGNVVLLEDFMKEALAKAIEDMKSRYGEAKEETAKSIAYGAVRYAILKISNDKNVTFDWESALSFEGDSGPYLQYNFARINSILYKYGKDLPFEADFSLLKETVEFELVKDIANFETIIKKALHELCPSIIANYVYGLTKKFSSFYHDCKVLNADTEELKLARLLLISAVRQVIENCLVILGIDTIDTM